MHYQSLGPRVKTVDTWLGKLKAGQEPRDTAVLRQDIKVFAK